MGRPKKKKVEALKPKTIAVRSTGEWAAWIERFAKHRRTDVAKLIDEAVIHLAKVHKFDEPPPERIP